MTARRSEQLNQPRTPTAFRNPKLLGSGYLGLSMLSLLAIVLQRNNAADVDSESGRAEPLSSLAPCSCSPSPSARRAAPAGPLSDCGSIVNSKQMRSAFAVPRAPEARTGRPRPRGSTAA